MRVGRSAVGIARANRHDVMEWPEVSQIHIGEKRPVRETVSRSQTGDTACRECMKNLR